MRQQALAGEALQEQTPPPQVGCGEGGRGAMLCDALLMVSPGCWYLGWMGTGWLVVRLVALGWLVVRLVALGCDESEGL